tara:strand:+ start:313 stop:537 length:225 start_codon:yes stop_codon:yes gene_type:complete
MDIEEISLNDNIYLDEKETNVLKRAYKAQQKDIEQLKIEKELLSGGLSRSVLTTKEVDAENTKLKEEIRILKSK